MTAEATTQSPQDLAQIVSAGDGAALAQFVKSQFAPQVMRAILRLPEDQQSKALTMLDPRQAARLIDEMPRERAVSLLQFLLPQRAAAIVGQMPSDEQADVIIALPSDAAEAILGEMEPEEAFAARELAKYAPDEAGGLMVTEFVSYNESMSARAVLDDLRRNVKKYANYDVQYVYCRSDFGDLVGVLRLRDLILARDDKPLAEFMIRKPVSVGVHATLQQLAELFGRHAFFGVPVVDEGGRLAGIIKRSDFEHAVSNQADSDFLKVQGFVVGEELRTMPIKQRVWRRLSWLTGNLFLDLAAVTVIAYYQNTLAAVIALAVFLPVISDMSGNAGIQAIAISLREMTLGVLKPTEIVWVCLKEASVGVINGIVLGILLGLVGWAYNGNAWLGLILAISMSVNTVIAAIVGGTLPMILKRMKFDPALSAGPLLTTITDMFGFFLVLSLATLLLNHLK